MLLRLNILEFVCQGDVFNASISLLFGKKLIILLKTTHFCILPAY